MGNTGESDDEDSQVNFIVLFVDWLIIGLFSSKIMIIALNHNDSE